MIQHLEILIDRLYFYSKTVIMILSHDDEYYMPLVETKDFIALIENKPFFDQAVKKKTRSI